MPKNNIKIAKEVSLPLDAVTQTIAVIGRKGSGKTYLATLLAEQMLDARAQVVILDPVGNWWGLRVGADGKTKGKDIFIIGGEHGDVPIVPDAGARIAQLLVDKGVSAILDISEFRIGERKRFTADFGEELLHLKKSNRSPVHIFIEEAQIIIPQRVGPEEARMVGAFEQIVRLGRNYGIGCTLITQRPQSVNKEVLSQVECLCVLQVTGPHERKALEAWVQEAGADRTLIGELPGLPQGEGYIWSPAWLRIYKRVKFLTKTTFDASATPEVGRETREAKLSSMDIKKLRDDMADVVEKAEQDDPRVLHRKIAELERHQCPKVTSQEDIDRAVKQALYVKDGEIDSERAEWQKQINNFFKILQEIGFIVSKELGSRPMPDIKRKIKIPTGIVPPFNTAAKKRIRKLPEDDFWDEDEEKHDEKPLKGGGLRMLQVLVSRYPMQFTKAQLATLSKMSARGGSYSTYFSALRTRGFIIENENLITASDVGLDYIGETHMPAQTTEETLNMWRNNLKGGARRMFDTLVEYKEDSITKEELGRMAEVSHTGGSFSTYLSMLKSNGLVEVNNGSVKISENLFL